MQEDYTTNFILKENRNKLIKNNYYLTTLCNHRDDENCDLWSTRVCKFISIDKNRIILEIYPNINENTMMTHKEKMDMVFVKSMTNLRPLPVKGGKNITTRKKNNKRKTKRRR